MSEIREALEALLDALEDGKLTAGELTRKQLRKARRQLRQWSKELDGKVLVEVDPRGVAAVRLALVFTDSKATKEERADAASKLFGMLLVEIL